MVMTNETADKFAKAAVAHPECVPEDIPDEPECIAKTAILHKFRDLWRSQWQAREDCRQTKFFRPKAGVSSLDLLTKSRKKISMFTQIMTGHNFLKRQESLVQGTTDSECRLCLEEEETSIHVFFQCQALRQQRIQIFRSGFLDQSQPWPLKPGSKRKTAVRGLTVLSLWRERDIATRRERDILSSLYRGNMCAILLGASL